MADDTRQPDQPPASNAENPSEPEFRRPRRPKPKHDFPKTQAGKLWEAFGSPEEPVNTMPGGMINSAGGRPAEVTWRDAFKNPFATKDGRRFWQVPCAKDSLLVGIGGGGAIGGVRFVFKGLTGVGATANWAVAAFCLSAGGMYTWCERRRKEEQKGMAAAVIGMKMLNEKKAKDRAVEQAAKMASLETEKRNKPWYKVW